MITTTFRGRRAATTAAQAAASAAAAKKRQQQEPKKNCPLLPCTPDQRSGTHGIHPQAKYPTSTPPSQTTAPTNYLELEYEHVDSDTRLYTRQGFTRRWTSRLFSEFQRQGGVRTRSVKSAKAKRQHSFRTTGVWQPFPRRLRTNVLVCLLYTSPSPRDGLLSRMPSSA